MIIASGPDNIALYSSAFLGLQLKHNWDLDVTLTKTLSLWSMDPMLCSYDYLMLVRTHYHEGLMLKGMVLEGKRRQISQCATWGQFESAVCLSSPIPLAKEFPGFLLSCLTMTTLKSLPVLYLSLFLVHFKFFTFNWILFIKSCTCVTVHLSTHLSLHSFHMDQTQIGTTASLERKIYTALLIIFYPLLMGRIWKNGW